MKSVRTICCFVFFILVWIDPVLLSGTPTIIGHCASGEFLCQNGNCIPMRWLCDGEDDCKDSSDEQASGTNVGGHSCSTTTCTQDEFTCGDGKCIPNKWKCDGEGDCSDHSDENTTACAKVTCKGDEFTCKTGLCIPLTWLCDRSDDCTDKSDELNCHVTCAADEFLCKNQKCISKRWKCDGENDCDDNSDEEDCGKLECNQDEFRCTNSEACIQGGFRCDGDNDCFDHSDEANCTHVEDPVTVSCSNSDFMCKSGDECIHRSWFCDGDSDCLDGSDENNQNCTHTCRSDQFMCNDQQCIYSLLRCDGDPDCNDESDEKNCTKPQIATCKADEFKCNNEGTCISMAKVCDKHRDCPDKEDETPELCSNSTNPCATHNGHCSQRCVNLHNGKHLCECDPGFELMVDGKVCDDVDECQVWGKCPQQCTNTKGSYKCTCDEGYVKIGGSARCAALGPSPFLLFSNHKDLRKFDPHTLKDFKLFRGAQNAIAMDYDINRTHIYWSDVSHSKIYRAKFQNNFTEMEGEPQEVHTNVKIPDGIAVDWIHDNLYFSDAQEKVISVSKSDGAFKRTLVSSTLEKPRAVAVDPRKGWVYWSDWGSQPKIERCGMNGAHRQTLIQVDIQWPNGLTIDFSTDRLYWVDAKLHIIASSKFNGQDRRTILYEPIKISHPFAITVFEDVIYWTDWSGDTIRYTNKFTGKQFGLHQELLLKLNQPAGIHVVHPYRQPKSKNVCGPDNQGCSHLCLPAPRKDDSDESLGGSLMYSCACRDGWTLKLDGKQCTNVLPPTGKSTQIPVQISTTGEGYSHANQNGNETATQGTRGSIPEQKDEESVGLVTGIVIGCAICLLMIIIVIGYILYRNHTKRNIRSMNFDNPVYRKTTDDQFGIDKKGSQRSIPSTLQPLTGQPGPDEVV